MAVTMLDIAKRLELSAATVSRVLSGKGAGFISEHTRVRVLDAAKEMGYRPNRVAQGLVSGKTKVVALWVRNPDAPFYASILRNIQELAYANGYEMILSGYRDQGGETLPPGAAEFDMNSWPVDGIIAADCPLRVQKYREADPNVPMSIVAVSTDFDQGVDSVTFDPEIAVETGVQHLVDVGCKSIVHLTGCCSVDRVQLARQHTYERVVQRAGLRGRIAVAADETRGTAREHVKKLWSEQRFDGLFCINDDVAIGAYRGLRDLGVRIGHDVALMGVDDIEDATYLDPALTTIQQPVDAMCARAWRMLEARWADPKAPVQREVLKPTLVVRESTTLFKK